MRSYARYLGLDPEWAYRTFCEEGNFANPQGISSGQKSSGQSASGEPRRSVARDPFKDPNVSFIPTGEAAMSRIEPAAIGSVAVLVAR